MAAQLPHSECCIYTYVSGANKQTVVNALTGESTEFPLPVAISDGGAYFDIGYSEAGWGWLKPIGGKDDDTELTGGEDGVGEVLELLDSQIETG